MFHFILRSEHERHSPICQYVRGEITENIPITLTAATQCAHQSFKFGDNKEKIFCTSELSSERYFAVSSLSGHIVVYDTKDILKVIKWHILQIISKEREKFTFENFFLNFLFL